MTSSHRQHHAKHQGGYITLLSVLVVGTVGAAVSLSLILLGTDTARTSFAYEQMYEAKALADACAQEGLEQVNQVPAYTGTTNVTLGAGTCSYTVSNPGSITIDAVGMVGTVVRKVQVTLSSASPVTPSSWQEVP